MIRGFLLLSCGIYALAGAAAGASETIAYTYDARGRLIKVVRSGTVNNGVQTDYQHDKANNRVRMKTIGSATTP